MPRPIKELTTGSTFANRYQIIEELGKGGMGKVYKVFNIKIKEKIPGLLLPHPLAPLLQALGMAGGAEASGAG